MFKKILKSKRGVAIEITILFMMMAFTFCALLTSIALWGSYRVKIESTQIENYVKVESVGEDFLYYLESPDFDVDAVVNDLDASYDYDVADDVAENGERYTLTVKNKDSETVVLTVVAEKSEGEVTLIQWTR